MKRHIGIAASLILSILLLAAMACESSEDSPAPTSPQESITDTAAPTATPETDNETIDIDNDADESMTAVITGTVTYRERIALSDGAVLIVKLVDVSRADAPSITIGEYEIANPGQVPLSFEIEYDPSEIDDRFTYAVQARINEGDDLAFISDTRYSVITRDNPTSVDMVLVKVGSPASEPEDTEASTTAVITGTVTYRERIALSDGAVLIVKLVDVSRADAPSITIGEYEIVNPGQVPLSFEIEYDPSEIDDRFTYAVQARINEGDDLAFISDTAYHVITRDNPTSVDMTLVKVANVSQSLPPNDKDEVDEAPAVEYVEVPAPIETVEVIESDGTYTIHIVSGLPGGCVEYNGYEMTRDGNTLNVTIKNLAPAPDALVACTMIYGYEETDIDLGESLTTGETYTVVVNGDTTTDFVASAAYVGEPDNGEADGPESVEIAAPIETVEVIESDGIYTLHIVSGLPGGCVEYSGYDLSRDGNTVSVIVTNLGPAPGTLVMCTAIYGYHETDIDLGDFVPGEEYTVVVNDKVTNGFVARDPEGPAMEENESPIEAVDVTYTKSDGYVLNIVSRLPLGSSCSKFNGYDVSSRFANTIEVTVTHLEVTAIVPCTKDLPVVATAISLGSDFVPGEIYKIIVNGETTEEFEAK